MNGNGDNYHTTPARRPRRAGTAIFVESLKKKLLSLDQKERFSATYAAQSGLFLGANSYKIGIRST
jgi:hypothetical protein